MSPIAVVHTALGTVALAMGAVVLLRRKGSRTHRWLGRVYVATMVALCVLSFGLRDSTPFFQGLGPFHVAACVSLGTVLAGFWTAWRRGDNWLGAHYMWMAWSYIGLVMATGGHVVNPLAQTLLDLGLARGLAIGIALGVAWAVPPLVGRRWIARRQPGWDRLGAPASAARPAASGAAL